MPENSTEVVRRYLEDAIAAETAFESQFRSFANETEDDEEVQSTFARYATETSSQIVRLKSRLLELGGESSKTKSLLSHMFSFGPTIAKIGHVPEERLTQNLIAGYSVGMSQCAMYEALLTVARFSGDTITVSLASDIASQELTAAQTLWHFLPSRSKIAFNVLTAGEIDPSVETKAPDDSLFS